MGEEKELGLTAQEMGLPEDQTPKPAIEVGKDELVESRELKKPEYPYSGIIIFGHGAREERNKLSQEARIRLLATYQLYKDGVAPRIIVTGGLPENDKRAYGEDVKSSGDLCMNF